MGQQLMTFFRLLFMTGALMGLVAVHDNLLGSRPGATDLTAAYLCSLVYLSVLVYYILGKLGMLAAMGPARVARPSPYHNMDGKTEIVMGTPKLTIENVWILVYGLGGIFFVVSYTFLGVEPVCLTCMGLGLGVLCADELVSPRREMNKLYTVVRTGAFLCGTISVCLIFVDTFRSMAARFFTTSNWIAAAACVGLPFIAQFLMLCVRDYRTYTVGGVLEMGEFGLPFAVILSLCVLWTAEGQRQQASAEPSYAVFLNETVQWYHNLTHQGNDENTTRWIIYLALAPLLLVPSLVLYLACILEGFAIDPLLCVSLALSLEYGTRVGPTVLNIYATLCALVGMLLRILGEYELKERPIFTGQQESTALPSVVFRKKRPDPAEPEGEPLHQIDEEEPEMQA